MNKTTMKYKAAYRHASRAVVAAALDVSFSDEFAPMRDRKWPEDLNSAAVLVAGDVAEALLEKKSFAQIFEAACADYHGVPSLDVGAAVMVAHKALDENWSAAEAVAAALLERETLSEAEVVGIFVISKRRKQESDE